MCGDRHGCFRWLPGFADTAGHGRPARECDRTSVPLANHSPRRGGTDAVRGEWFFDSHPVRPPLFASCKTSQRFQGSEKQKIIPTLPHGQVPNRMSVRGEFVGSRQPKLGMRFQVIGNALFPEQAGVTEFNRLLQATLRFVSAESKYPMPAASQTSPPQPCTPELFLRPFSD
mgnify:CR=1 FL=1